MNITKEFLQAELQKMEQQRNHAHDVAVASQAAMDVLNAMIARIDLPDSESTNNEGVENGSV